MDKAFFEITRQYDVLAQTIEHIRQKRNELENFHQQAKPKSIVFVGSGSSYCIAQSAEIIARSRFGIPAFSITSGDALVNFQSSLPPMEGALTVGISRSGNTTELVSVLKAMQQQFGSAVVGITCVEESELSEIADVCLKMPWAFDECVCQTGTITNLYATVAMLLSAFRGDNGVFDDFQKAASAGNDFIKQYDRDFQRIAEKQWNKVVVLADGEISGLADEAALAFKEISCTVSNYYHVLDVRHGPMVLIDKDTLVLADLKPENKKYQLDLIHDIGKKGAVVVVCTDDSYDTIPSVALHVKHGDVGMVAEGLPFINIAQMVAYYKAIQKGVDPGSPEGLDAWINLA